MKKRATQTLPSSKTGPKEPPSQIQLPGGVMLKGYDFRITRVDAKGRPTHFELAVGNTDSDCTLWASPSFMNEKLPAHLSVGNTDSDCTLWASPSFMNEKLPAHLSERYKKRIEDSIEGPERITCACGKEAFGEDGTGAFACSEHGGPVRPLATESRTYVASGGVGGTSNSKDHDGTVVMMNPTNYASMRDKLQTVGGGGASGGVNNSNTTMTVGYDPGYDTEKKP